MFRGDAGIGVVVYSDDDIKRSAAVFFRGNLTNFEREEGEKCADLRNENYTDNRVCWPVAHTYFGFVSGFLSKNVRLGTIAAYRNRPLLPAAARLVYLWRDQVLAQMDEAAFVRFLRRLIQASG